MCVFVDCNLLISNLDSVAIYCPSDESEPGERDVFIFSLEALLVSAVRVVQEPDIEGNID